MDVQMKSDELIIYQDYSVAVKCSQCQKWESYETNSKQATMLNQFQEKAKTWVCGDCYRKETTPPTFDEARQEQIAYGQSWNLAVALISQSYSFLLGELVKAGKKDGEGILDYNIKKDIVKWQSYFYDKLTNRK